MLSNTSQDLVIGQIAPQASSTLSIFGTFSMYKNVLKSSINVAGLIADQLPGWVIGTVRIGHRYLGMTDTRRVVYRMQSHPIMWRLQ